MGVASATTCPAPIRARSIGVAPATTCSGPGAAPDQRPSPVPWIQPTLRGLVPVGLCRRLHGDDDWYEPGESSTLSFPSYYIDAEAVVCLDGGDCIIRSGLVAAKDNSALDTSIACDSCDLWYHAICVGFNPENTSEDSWLCPRCVSPEAKNESEVVLKQNISGDSDRTSTDASFSGRVSVSGADDGETALVVD